MTKKKVETRAFDAEVGKVLQLMIHSLYTNKDIFLRELISNASDACDKLRYASLQDSSLSSDDIKITISADSTNSTLTITDNGIGMSKEELIENLGTVARSGTQRFMASLENSPQTDVKKLIGQFGVGFYSAYMVADKVLVESTKAGSDETYAWESDGKEGYTVSPCKETLPRGTKITLYLKSSEAEFLEHYKLHHIIQTYSDHINFPIILIDEQGKDEAVNKASALWARPKSEISEAEYNEFYHHISHSPDTPWLTLHHKAEGALEYTSLLYIPSIKPHDLFHPDRQSRVKLYVKKVFITDNEVNIIPAYMRFLRGVVDSEDLPLNISRETLQNSNLLSKIKQSVVKKVLSTLKDRAKNDPSSYQTFWSNFGEVMKEGLCEGALPEKEQLLEVCYFRTSKSADKSISLDDYINGMVENQEDIFYFNGDTIENLMSNPVLEGFNQRNIEVLLLPDHVDDFWINIITQYKNKALRSIATSNIDLNAIQPLEEKNDDVPAPSNEDNAALIDYLKKTLDTKVKDVVLSSKLVESPSSLATTEGAMNIRMERFLIAQKQLKKASAKTLEINPKHHILLSISRAIKDGTTGTETEELANIIFQQACLIAGEEMEDPSSFIKIINSFIIKSIQ